jgi:hypothetical protein
MVLVWRGREVGWPCRSASPVPRRLGGGRGERGRAGTSDEGCSPIRGVAYRGGGEAGRWGLRVGDAHVEELLRGGLHARGRIGTVLSAGLKDLETRVE